MISVDEGIWKVVGKRSGKVVTILGGTHGNEGTGVEVINQLRKRIFQVDAGELYLIHANMQAIEHDRRFTKGGVDLNRQFTKDVMSRAEYVYEHTRAKVLAPIIAKSDVVIDIHCTNKPSVPMIAPPTFTKEHERIARWFDCRVVVTDPHQVFSGEPSTIDDYVQMHGGIGFTFESGQVGDVNHVDEITESIMNVLREVGVIIEAVSRMPYVLRWEVYEMLEPVMVVHDDFNFASGRGEESFEPFFEGDVLCVQDGETYVAQYDGFIMFPKILKHVKVGVPAMYLARLCTG